MTNPVYTRAQATAYTKLKKYGVAVTVTNAADVAMKGYGAILDVMVENADFSTSSAKILFAAPSKGFIPLAGDYVDAGNQSWTVKSVDPLQPDGQTTILYKLMVTT